MGYHPNMVRMEGAAPNMSLVRYLLVYAVSVKSQATLCPYLVGCVTKKMKIKIYFSEIYFCSKKCQEQKGEIDLLV
jgi:hypothetical protein